MAITQPGSVQTAGDSNGSSLNTISRSTTTTDAYNIIDIYLEAGATEAAFALTFSNGTWVKVFWQLQVGPAPDFTHARYIEKYAGAGATFNITWSGGVGSIWRAAIVDNASGVDLTTPQDTAATSAASASSSASATAPGVTTATNGALVYYSESDFNGRTVTPPTGTTPTFTERSDFANLETAVGIMATAGATGDKTGTLNIAEWNTAGLMALRPTGAGGGGSGAAALVGGKLLDGGPLLSGLMGRGG